MRFGHKPADISDTDWDNVIHALHLVLNQFRHVWDSELAVRPPFVHPVTGEPIITTPLLKRGKDYIRNFNPRVPKGAAKVILTHCLEDLERQGFIVRVKFSEARGFIDCWPVAKKIPGQWRVVVNGNPLVEIFESVYGPFNDFRSHNSPCRSSR